MLYIGIDCGKHTGLAVWDSTERSFISVDTTSIHRAMDTVRRYALEQDIKVVFEDARQRKWYTGNVSAKAQGAGSVKRDCTIWEDFLTDFGIPFEAAAPKAGMTKWTPLTFRRLTRWCGKTSEHSRDAAVLVWGRY